MIDIQKITSEFSIDCFRKVEDGVWACNNNIDILHLKNGFREKNITLDIHENASIESIIEQSFSSDDIEYIIDDDSVINVLDGVIKPLKIGKATISFKDNQNLYFIEVCVGNDALNPKTGTFFYLVVTIFIISTIIMIFQIFIKKILCI